MKIAQIHSLYLNCNTVCTDTRKIQNNDIFFALTGDNFNGNTYAEQALKKGAQYAIIDDPKYNTSENMILVEDVLKSLQELAAFHRTYLNIPIIALTGSNGKTTTKELINVVLSKQYNTTATVGNLNNHIGVPLTLLSMNKHTEIGIVEMGANHLKEIAFLCEIAQPDYGYITNFGKAHLEGFGGIEGVIRGKSEMYDFLSTHDKLIFVNANDPIQVEKTKTAKTFQYGADEKANDVHITLIEVMPFVKANYNGLEIQSKLIGDYNFNNIAVAITIGNYFKVEDGAIKHAIESYRPTNNRSQIINKGNHQIILDAYNANPTSMTAALYNFSKQSNDFKIAILGDMFELGNDADKEHQNIVDLAEGLNLDQVILIGEHFHKTRIVAQKQIKFKSFDDFKNQFQISSLKDAMLLIKGSRGMALERVLDLL